VSSITHFAEVKEVIEDADIDMKYKMMAFGDNMDKEAVRVDLGELQELEDRVGSGGVGIQKVKYTTLEELKEAESVQEL